MQVSPVTAAAHYHISLCFFYPFLSSWLSFSFVLLLLLVCPWSDVLQLCVFSHFFKTSPLCYFVLLAKSFALYCICLIVGYNHIIFYYCYLKDANEQLKSCCLFRICWDLHVNDRQNVITYIYDQKNPKDLSRIAHTLLSDVKSTFLFKGHHLSIDPVQTTAALIKFSRVFMAVSHNNKFPSCSISFSLTARAKPLFELTNRSTSF